ncbi:MAG: PAS domain S-box protein [Candidatus Zixiibacteriota bacterium]|nr:MAG: PAS domain S-box protein [candidate division Zixibacteria bacterium]
MEQRYIATLIILLAIIVFVITWYGIRESRADSMKLLVMQGTAFVEALTEAANSAIESERFFDYLVHKRFSELTVELAQLELTSITNEQLMKTAMDHGLYGLYVYGADSVPVAGGLVRGSMVKPPQYVVDEIMQILANPEDNYVLLLDQGDDPDEMVHYYIEITNNLDRVILIVADALYYVDALSQTQIGYLSQKMGQEKGVEYIIFQSTEGIVFSSRKTPSLLAIESDPFLSEALNSDSVAYRPHVFDDTEVLELVRPFATRGFPFGLLRVGLNLENYNAISRGYDRQMVTLSGTLFILVLVVILYFQTRRKRKEITRQYREIKSISDKIFDEMETGVAAVDSGGVITLANRAFERVFDVSAVTGEKWNKLISVSELSFDTIMTRKESSLEYEFSVGSDSDRKWLLLAVSKMMSESNEPSGLAVVVYDITRLKELEQKAARKERLSEMGNLAAGVAHEIRNPLNTISIAAQRLAGEFAPAENSEEYLAFTKQIRTETKRLNEIITRFLALAHEEKEKAKVTNLAQVVEEFLQLVRYEAESVNIDISAQIDPTLEISVDRDSMKQVLSNLFNNSKEALEGRSGKIAVRGVKKEHEIELRFGDSGHGIKSELREKVFTPFYTSKGTGTGLGLPTVYKIISDFGGDVRVQDSPLGGAEIVINLPS